MLFYTISNISKCIAQQARYQLDHLSQTVSWLLGTGEEGCLPDSWLVSTYFVWKYISSKNRCSASLFCIREQVFLHLALILGAESSQATTYTFYLFLAIFSIKKENANKKLRLGISWNSRPVWLQAAFHFGTENWDDQLKNTMYKKEWVFSRNKVLWGCSCSENALCLVPYLLHSQLLTQQRGWKVSHM